MMSEDMMKSIPVYPHTDAYASEHGELSQFRESNLANIACRSAIDLEIRRNFDGMYLDAKAVKTVFDTFGVERTMFVLANTVQQKSWDGRFSAANKQWAATIPVPEDVTGGFDRRVQYTATAHPAVLDGFISMARKEAERIRSQPKKTSLHDRLKKVEKSTPKPARQTRQKAAEVR